MTLPVGQTTLETLTVNGVVLNTYAKNIESLAGRLRTPTKRTANITVPGRHGTARTSGKKFSENILTLPMWVIGGDDTGAIPGGSTARKEFFKRMDELSFLFLGSDGPLDIRHTLPDGTVRQCFADVLDAIDFSTESASPLAKFGVSLTVSGAFWQDITDTVQTVTGTAASMSFGQFAGATAPMEELKATITGPWNNPRLTFADGSWVQYSASMTAGQGIIVDSATWTLTGVGGLTPSLSALTYSALTSNRWMPIPPSGTAALVVSLTGSARTAASSLKLEGRRKYLVG